MKTTPTTQVELIYDDDCPNVEAARAQLRLAMGKLGLRPRWREWERHDPSSPPCASRYGSPTILVDGTDVAGAAPTDGAACCRVYLEETGQGRGVPPARAIVAALTAKRASPPGRWRGLASVLPAAAMGGLPIASCPACWPAYAGLLGVLGLGFLLDRAYQIPLTILFLAATTIALALGASRRGSYGPIALGAVAAGVVLAGRFVFQSNTMFYGGLVLLILACIWNSLPNRRGGDRCPVCASSAERK